ncbi:hypothetical protein C8035_v001351 [Colletotrichum spinosum]|uniref:Uncharacterized protein n=1 Tax=Colletotrichum spinosum TaxID=1347390 RepID=A0A4R8Q0Q2_9PEZI|nr:hypothetical protein C8035_v001351 [Colletotrichum spinosum]
MSRSQATAPMVLRVDVGRTCHQPDDDQMRVRRHPEARQATINADIVKLVVSQELVTDLKNNNSDVVITSAASSTPGSRLEPYSALSRPNLAQALQQRNRGGPPASLRSQHQLRQDRVHLWLQRQMETAPRFNTPFDGPLHAPDRPLVRSSEAPPPAYSTPHKSSSGSLSTSTAVPVTQEWARDDDGGPHELEA